MPRYIDADDFYETFCPACRMERKKEESNGHWSRPAQGV